MEGAPRPGREWAAGSEAAKRSSRVDLKKPHEVYVCEGHRGPDGCWRAGGGVV